MILRLSFPDGHCQHTERKLSGSLKLTRIPSISMGHLLSGIILKFTFLALMHTQIISSDYFKIGPRSDDHGETDDSTILSSNILLISTYISSMRDNIVLGYGL